MTSHNFIFACINTNILTLTCDRNDQLTIGATTKRGLPIRVKKLSCSLFIVPTNEFY